MMDFSKLTELDKGFRPAFCDGGAGTECCDMGCTASREQSELTAERPAKTLGAAKQAFLALDRVQRVIDSYVTVALMVDDDLDTVRKYLFSAKEAAAPSIQALPVVAEPTAPAILEAMSWHARERDDLTLEDAVKAFRFGYKEVRQRDDRAMLAQIIHLLAEAPAAAQPEAKEAPAALSDDDKELCQWLRDHSSGAYRKSAEAADRIEALAAAGNSQDAKDAARWRFIMRAGDDENSPEMQAIERLGSDVLEDDRPNSVQMAELTDAAIAAMAAAPSPAEPT